ncbi:uncharacterized protein LOC135130999 [Zophobas morio]|uniref:uncharacterized protein LOC135130999 n=1 Tax=Zophobas morio TaxID=2755281 RepID=UPI003083DFCF
MKHYFIVFFVVALLTHKSLSTDETYYWKDYDGTIPDDALEGGYDIHSNSIFIGKAQVGEDHIVVPIYPNISDVQTFSDGKVEKINSGIKILCGSEQPVDWIRASAENFHVVLIGKNPVQGGELKNKGHLHVGRIFYENEIKIGPILSYDLDKACLHFVHKHLVLSTDKYEVLVYDSPRERPRRPWNRRGPGRRFH